MFRRVVTRFSKQTFDETAVPGISLEQACAIFGYSVTEKFDKKELRKRFGQLALKYHPDHGGTEQQIMILIEAHKVLQAVRHDKHEDRGFRYGFTRANSRNEKEPSIKAQSLKEQVCDRYDLAFALSVACIIVYSYGKRILELTKHVAGTRRRMLPNEVHREPDFSYLEASPTAVPAPLKDAGISPSKTELPSSSTQTNRGPSTDSVWHPWRASQPARDEVVTTHMLRNSVEKQMHAIGELKKA